MSAWEVYLVTRCDAVHAAFMICTIVSVMVLGTAWLIYSLACIMGAEELSPKEKANGDRIIKRLTWWMAPLLLVLSLGTMAVPTTKQAAAIWVIPRLTSPQVQAEAGEFYGLAKEWLAQQVRGKQLKREQPEKAP